MINSRIKFRCKNALFQGVFAVVRNYISMFIVYSGIIYDSEEKINRNYSCVILYYKVFINFSNTAVNCLDAISKNSLKAMLAFSSLCFNVSDIERIIRYGVSVK